MNTAIVVITSGVLSTGPLLLTTDAMQIEFKPRTPDQMGSFYEARGFPAEMRDIIKQHCFITVGIHNTSRHKLWLDLANWRFSDADGKAIERIHRNVWKQRWQAMDIPLRYQSTFRWTLIPEALDYLPGEDEGGNITLPYTAGPITVEARFLTGDDKNGAPIDIRYDKLYCAQDQQ